jgi:hypothetical protein
MGGSTNIDLAGALQNPLTTRSTSQWAVAVCDSYAEARQTQDSFTATELHKTDLKAPRGNIIFSAGDPSSVVQNLPPTIETDAIPELTWFTTTPKGIRFVSANVKKHREWRLFILHNTWN